MKLKDIFMGIMAVGVSAIYLTRMSGRVIDMANINNHAAELDSAQDVYGPLFNRWEALTLNKAHIDSAYASQLREKYGDKIGANEIISAKKQELSRKELESYIRPVYSEDYFNILPPRKEFDFRKDFMENTLKLLGYTPKDILYRLPDGSQELEPITIPKRFEGLKLIEIKES